MSVMYKCGLHLRIQLHESASITQKKDKSEKKKDKSEKKRERSPSDEAPSAEKSEKKEASH